MEEARIRLEEVDHTHPLNHYSCTEFHHSTTGVVAVEVDERIHPNTLTRVFPRRLPYPPDCQYLHPLEDCKIKNARVQVEDLTSFRNVDA